MRVCVYIYRTIQPPLRVYPCVCACRRPFVPMHHASCLSTRTYIRIQQEFTQTRSPVALSLSWPVFTHTRKQSFTNTITKFSTQNQHPYTHLLWFHDSKEFSRSTLHLPSAVPPNAASNRFGVFFVEMENKQRVQIHTFGVHTYIWKSGFRLDFRPCVCMRVDQMKLCVRTHTHIHQFQMITAYTSKCTQLIFTHTRIPINFVCATVCHYLREGWNNIEHTHIYLACVVCARVLRVRVLFSFGGICFI